MARSPFGKGTTLLGGKWKITSYNSAMFQKMGAMKKRALIRIGFYGRAVMKNSMKKVSAKNKFKTHSIPPAPPFAHIGTLRTFIFAGYDQLTDTSVVGPEKLTGHKNMGAYTVPQLLHEGGSFSARRVVRVHAKPRTTGAAPTKKSSATKKPPMKPKLTTVKTLSFTYKPRPYSAGSPNYYATLKKFPEILVDVGFVK